jgi:hypothetical protein
MKLLMNNSGTVICYVQDLAFSAGREDLGFLLALHLWRPAFTFACRKTPLQIHFIYLGNKKIYSIFKTCCTISVLFSTKCLLFHMLCFFVQITCLLYTLSKANARWEGLHGQMILRAMPAEALATGRATLLDRSNVMAQTKGDTLAL